MSRKGYSIFIDTVVQGPVPSVTESVEGSDGNEIERACVFITEREAQLEIVDAMMIRLQQFIDGKRDFDDAVTLEEYVVEVSLEDDSQTG